jgi:ubiquinone/menaquinone biosynthesis C-methylase UbiE
MDANIVKNSEMTAFNDTEAFLSWEEGPYWTRVQQNIIKKLSAQFNKVESVLEVGCGKSVYLPLTEKKGGIAVGMDISKSLLKLNTRCERVLGDGENLAFAPSSFDYVFVVGAIHHMPDKDRGLKEISKVCKNKLLIIEPHSMSLNWIYWVIRKIAISLFGYEKVKKWAGFVAPHESFVSKKMVEKNLSDFQFKITFCSPFRAPPLKALSRINFEAINMFLEKIPGIRRMGTYIIIEGERIRGNEL